MDVRWLDRGGAPAGTTTLLQDAVLSTEFPADARVFGWAGAEFAAFRTIRSHWRQTRRLPRDQHLCVAY